MSPSHPIDHPSSTSEQGGKKDVLTRWYRFLLRHRLPLLVLCVGLPVGLGYFSVPDLDDSIRIWFLDDDPEVQVYDRFIQHFGSDEFVAIAVQAEDVFDREVLRDIERMTAVVEGYGSDYSVTSLTSAELSELVDQEWDGEVTRTIRIRTLGEVLADSGGDPAALRRLVHQDRLASQLVSEDDRATLLLIHHPRFETSTERVVLSRQLRTQSALLMPGRRVHLSGIAVSEEAFQSLTLSDLRKFIPITAVVILVATFLLFQSFWASFIPMLVVAFSVVSTMGVAGLLGVRMNFATMIIVPLTMAVSVCICVHLIVGYRDRLHSDRSPGQALESMWVDLFLPCLLSAVTTAGGLLSLPFTSLRPLRQFGWLGATAVLFSLVYGMLLIPIAYSYLAPPRRDPRLDRRIFTRVLGGLAHGAWRWPRHITVVTAILCLLVALGLPRLGINSDLLSYFEEDTRQVRDSRFIDEELGGSLMIDVMAEAPSVLEPRVLSAFEELEDYLMGRPEVNRVSSPASIVKILHERYFGDPAYYRIPRSLAAVAQLVEQVAGSYLYRNHVNRSATMGHLTARFDGRHLVEVIENHPALQAHIDGAFEGLGEGHVTGYGRLVVQMHKYIPVSQIRSFLVAFLVIGLLIILAFRSLRIGVWAFFPNVVPILVLLGGMGWLGLQLDVATVMIASILLGLIVDDTVHFLARFRIEERKASLAGENLPLQAALRRTALGTGRAMITTTVILTAAFWTLLLASFVPIQHFGLISGAGAVLALFCDLLLTPVCIRLLPLQWLTARTLLNLFRRRRSDSLSGLREEV